MTSLSSFFMVVPSAILKVCIFLIIFLLCLISSVVSSCIETALGGQSASSEMSSLRAEILSGVFVSFFKGCGLKFPAKIKTITIWNFECSQQAIPQWVTLFLSKPTLAERDSSFGFYYHFHHPQARPTLPLSP